MNSLGKSINFPASILLMLLLFPFGFANASCPVEEALKKPLQEACQLNALHLWLIAEAPDDPAIYKEYSFASDNQTRLLVYLGNDLVKLAGGKDRNFDYESGEILKMTCDFISKCTEDLSKKIGTDFKNIAEVKMARNEILQCTSTRLKKYLVEKHPSDAPEAIALGFPNVSYCKQGLTLEVSPTLLMD